MFRHLVSNACIGLLLIIAALLVGMLGYHHYEVMGWTDAFLNASMILSGMGPANTMISTGGKIFAGCYALFSGLVFIAIMALVFTPIIHAFFRKIHLESTRNTHPKTPDAKP